MLLKKKPRLWYEPYDSHLGGAFLCSYEIDRH
jgi:hypothetical protein